MKDKFGVDIYPKSWSLILYYINTIGTSHIVNEMLLHMLKHSFLNDQNFSLTPKGYFSPNKLFFFERVDGDVNASFNKFCFMTIDSIYIYL